MDIIFFNMLLFSAKITCLFILFILFARNLYRCARRPTPRHDKTTVCRHDGKANSVGLAVGGRLLKLLNGLFHFYALFTKRFQE
jgi:hypothetical protein